jgi:hypothetical protein
MYKTQHRDPIRFGMSYVLRSTCSATTLEVSTTNNIIADSLLNAYLSCIKYFNPLLTVCILK